jgi:hypothetical protein
VALILTEQILSDLVSNIQSNAQAAMDDETCLVIIARSFGYKDHLDLLSAITESPPVPKSPAHNSGPLLDFWQSGKLNSFITDYACRKHPVILALGGDNSLIILSTSPPKAIKIIEGNGSILLTDLGPLPLSLAAPPTILGNFVTPHQAFDALCQWNDWDWFHSVDHEQ